MQADQLFKRAFEEHQSGNLAAAQDLYRQLLLLHPAHFGVLGLLGTSLSQEGKHQDGVLYLERAQWIDRHHLPTRCNLANAYLASGLLQKSLGSFKALMVLAPDNASYFSGLGHTDWLLMHPDRSLFLLNRAKTIQPDDSEKRSKIGALYSALGRHMEATSSFQGAIILSPGEGEDYLNLAVCHAARNETKKALFILSLGLKTGNNPSHFLEMLGNIQSRRGAIHEAIAATKNALVLDPAKAKNYLKLYLDASSIKEDVNARKYYQSFIRLSSAMEMPFEFRESLDRLTEHLERRRSLKEVILIAPNIPEGYLVYGHFLDVSGLYHEARACYEMGSKINPDNELLISSLSIQLQQSGDFSSASRLLGRYSIRNPSSAEVEYLRGVVAQTHGNSIEAQGFYDRALKLNPLHTRACVNRGLAMMAIGYPWKGLKDQERSILVAPDLTEAYLNRGMMLLATGNFEVSSRTQQRAVHLDPSLAEPYTLLGLCLSKLNKCLDTSPLHRQAIILDPKLAEAYINLGEALTDPKNNPLSADYLKRGLFISPFSSCGLSHLLHKKHQRFDWFQDQEILNDIRKSIRTLEIAQNPFALLAMVDDPELHLQAARLSSRRLSYVAPTFKQPAVNRKKKIRVGYFSADFHDHATMHLAAEMFELSDKAKFEVFMFSFGPDKRDVWRARAVAASDQFIDISDSSLMESIAIARESNLDIAIDLKGFTEDSRPEIFKSRVAPVQISYLGYPGTCGLPEMDYIIADPYIIPERLFKYYDEKVIQLPDTYQSNRRLSNTNALPVTRKDHGLPEDGFIFCSFNAAHKIGSEVFLTWTRILKMVPKSYLWILVQDPMARENLKRSAKEIGLDPNRILFCPSLPSEQHLARLRLADLFLDTFPYNAHTTASDALRMGLPVLTLSGVSFASRVAGSLLTACNMRELITETLADYERKAVEIALDPDLANQLKKKTQINAPSSPLFDSERFTRHIEKAFEIVYHSAEKKLPAEHIRWVDLA